MGELLKKVAAVAKLQKRDLKKPDKMPTTYDHQPFVFIWKADLELYFEGNLIKTPVYVNATEPLLLSKGVCCQL